MKILPRQLPKLAAPRWILKLALGLALVALVAAAISVVTALVVYRQLSGGYDLSKVSQMPSRSEVFDADGRPYGRLQSEQNRVLVPLKDISPRLIDAVLTREDARFWEHHGVDPRGIARALARNIRSGGAREGASTITQQLARNTFALGGQNLHRKMLEAMVARRIEEKYSKEQILEFYLNRIYLGAGVYGVEAAAQKYFGKTSKELSLGESAMLAGIIRNPNRNSPARNLDGAKSDRNSVLDRMATLHKISPQEAAAAKAEPVRVARNQAAPMQADYVMEAVRGELDDYVSADQINAGGLRVYTTVDPRLQRLAAEIVERQLAKVEQGKKYDHLTRAQYLARIEAGEKPSAEASPDYLQGALLAVDNRTGAIVAMVGGRSFEESHYNRALYAKRQVGSTFKPFVYAAAFERGLQPDTMVEDSPLRPGEIKTVSREWKPENSDQNFLGLQRADLGLIQSRNIMSIRVGEWAGMDSVLSLARRAGVRDVPALPSMYLGSFETTLKNLTGAYTMFPNQGAVREPYFIERIDAADGHTIYQAPHEERKAASPLIAQMTSNILERVMLEGTAKQAASLGLRVPAAGKTGTTNDYKDAWFMGYTTSLTCGVWVGLDKPQTIMAKGYGSALSLPIWVDFMQEAAGNSARRYPALALHGAASQLLPDSSAPVRTASDGGFMYAGNDQTDAAASQVPPSLAPPDEETAVNAAPNLVYQAPSEPGSQFIRDPRTGRIIGVDGSAGAEAEATSRQWPRALPVEPAPAARPAAGQPGVYEGRVVNNVSAPVVSAAGSVPAPPVRRAQPVNATQNYAVQSSPQAFGAPAPRAQYSVKPRRSYSKVYTLPDGSRIISRTEDTDSEE